MGTPKPIDGVWLSVADAARETGADKGQLLLAAQSGLLGEGRSATYRGKTYIHIAALMEIREHVARELEARNLAGAIFHDAAGREIDGAEISRAARGLL